MSEAVSNINLDSRRYPSRPLLGIGAIIFDDGKLLIVERGKEPLKGYWSLPGGILEVGETLMDGIRREVLEETGLEVEPLTVFEIFERIMPDANGKTEYHYVLIDYLCKPVGGRLQAASDVSRVAWVSQQKLAEYRLTEGTLAVVERAFAKLQLGTS
jgi:ADP-ribose pyrophosphatase YjhB (NUDIX family)